MSGILAIFNRRGEPASADQLEVMLAACPERAVDGEDIWCDGPIGFAHQHFWITPEEQGERQPLVDSEPGLAIVADIRLDNRDEILHGLGAPQDLASRTSDARLVLMAYRRWGEECVSKLLGDFSFAIWDRSRQQLLLARDALGTRGLYYFVDDRHCLAASEIDHLLAHPAVRAQINDRRVAEWLAGREDNDQHTFYRNIYCCSPGHTLVVTAQSMHQQRYWQIDPDAQTTYLRQEEYAEHFLDILRSAVASRAHATGPIGISMSGGLDSTTLAAILAEYMACTARQKGRLKSFSYTFDELTTCDERRWIEPVVERYGIDAEYIPCDNMWTLNNFESWPTLRNTIYADAYGWLPDAVRKAGERSGIRVLFAGYFGDGLCKGQDYWPVDMVRDGKLVLMLNTLVQYRGRISRREAILKFGLFPTVPRGAKQLFRTIKPRPSNRYHAGIHPRLASNLLEDDIDPNLERLYHKPGQLARRNTLLMSGMSLGASEVWHQYNRHRIELALPYWDQRLVSFVMSVPAYVLGRPGTDRKLMRDAARDLLPESVRLRSRRTSFRPLLHRGLVEKEKARTLEILNNPLIVQQEYADPSWLKDQIGKLRQEGHVGIALWMFVCLELWLRKYWS